MDSVKAPQLTRSPLHGDRPAVSVVEFTDPITAGHGIELIAQDAVQLQSSPLRVRRVIVRLGDAHVVFHSANQRVRTRTSANDGLLAFVTFGPLTRGTMNGLTVSPDALLAAEPNAEAGFVTEAGWESLTVLIRPDLIAAQLGARQRIGGFRMPHGVMALQAPADKVRRLFEWGRRLVTTAAGDPTQFNDSAERRAAAQSELIEMLLATLCDAAGREPGRRELTRHHQSRIVKVAEEHALRHVGERVYLADLCQAAGAGERALEYAFKEILGLTPTAYLVKLRLHRARDALQTARPGERTVSDVALDWGFWHLGEFSRAYKECFGESPSETLRRAPGDMQVREPG